MLYKPVMPLNICEGMGVGASVDALTYGYVEGPYAQSGGLGNDSSRLFRSDLRTRGVCSSILFKSAVSALIGKPVGSMKLPAKPMNVYFALHVETNVLFEAGFACWR
jgi:hypothetical protein